MRHGTSALRGALLACGLTVAGLAPANANIVWDLSSNPGLLGPTSSYTSGGYTITATGYADRTLCLPSHTCGGTTDLYGKTSGGDESGLGIASDPSGDNEIWGTTFVQLDLTQPYAASLHTYQFQMGSTTGGEEWQVYGDTVSATDSSFNPTHILTGLNDEFIHNLTGYDYYFFIYTGPTDGSAGGDNVLLYKTFSAVSAPESSTWAMMLLGFAGLGFAGHREAKGAAAFAA